MFFDRPFGGVVPGAQGTVLSVLMRTDTPLTGRQIHAMVSESHSLWSVQSSLRILGQLGMVATQSIGRAGVHSINENHVAVVALRGLVDPIAALTSVVERVVDDPGATVLLFGSIARGEATANSDIDLAVITDPAWEGSTDLEDAVRGQLGNACDVLTFTPDEFTELARQREPVVADILGHGVALIGRKPHIQRGAA